MQRSALVLLSLCAVLCAQEDPRGRIEGLVSDAGGAAVPTAKVEVRNTDTGVAIHTSTNEMGRFEIPYLTPGVYELKAAAQGFKSVTRPGLELRSGDRMRVDLSLEIGNLTESIEVRAEAPVLENASSTMGQVLSSKEASDLPQRGGSLAWLYSLAPGTIQPGLPAGGPWNIDQASDASAAGAGRRSFDFNVDGVSNNAYGGRTAFVPPAEMVQEVKIETSNYDSSIGHSTGGSVNVSLKSGTNKLHANLGASLATGPMLTRNFFVNRFIFDPATGPITPEKIKENTPVDRWLRMSAAVGGPVYLPKIYNGRNRTFWMFGYQGHDRSQPVAESPTVPTEAQRGGDFSALLKLGSQYQIYDPFTTVPQGARFARQPLAGNIIPASRIDKAALNILKYFPLPNTPGTADFQNNYTITTPKEQVLKQPIARVDHNFGQNWRTFFRYSQSEFNGKFDQYVPNSDVRGRYRTRPHRGAALDNVFVLSPSMVLDVRYGFVWFQEGQSFYSQGRDLKEFGFPASLVNQLDPAGVTFPQIMISGLLQLGNDGGYLRRNYTHSLLNVLSWVRGNHSVKFGADLRMNLENYYTYGNASPRLNFDPVYARGPLDNSTAAPAGQGLASFLFGIPTGGQIDLNDSRAERSGFYSGFVQDDWRIGRNLTVNLGFRYELEGELVERWNRTSLDMDFITPNPIEARAKAQYAKAPIPEVPVSQFRTLGGLTFAGVGGNPRSVRPTSYGAWMPRIGFAWQLSPRAVLRGGYGIFYGLLGADFSDVSQPGFNQRTTVVPTNDNGLTYSASIANPFPAGLEKPQGAAAGLATYLGRGPGFFSQDGRRPSTQRWSLSAQYQPMRHSVIELGYIGSRSGRQRVPTEFNPIPANYLSTSPVRDQAVIDSLSAPVSNPFLGIEAFAGTAYYTGKTTARSQLLRPYPHFGSLSDSLPAGMNWYHAFTASFQRRFAAGLQFQANYTWSKSMTATEYLNETDSLPLHTISDLDRPHRLVMSGVFEMPFGKGKKIAGGAPAWVNHIIGGWQVQAIYQAQSGPALEWGNVIYTGDFTAIPLGDGRNIDRWFDTSGFERDSRKQLANNIRTFPKRISAARAAGINLIDLGMFKYFRIVEGLRVQLRADAEGAANHPHFNPPNMSPTSTLFGRVSATQTGEGERRIFAGLRIIF